MKYYFAVAVLALFSGCGESENATHKAQQHSVTQKEVKTAPAPVVKEEKKLQKFR